MAIPEGFSNSYVDQQDAMIADLRAMLSIATARLDGLQAYAADRDLEVDLEVEACHNIMAECRTIAGDQHTSIIDAVRGLLARAERAETALAACDDARVAALDQARWVGQKKDWDVDAALSEAHMREVAHELLMVQLAESNMERDAARARAEKTEAALAARNKPCAFEQEDESSYIWNTDCGGSYWLEDGTPDQHYKFCPECGHPFIVRIGAPPSDNDLLSPDQEEL